MTLKIHNSLTKALETFQPITPGKITMYVCGMTVYDYCHIGHGRMLVVFDMVTRYLRARGYEVNYVRNITDIDDKIIKRANELGESVSDVTERFIRALHEDEATLNVLPPSHQPRATEHMAEMIAMIETLIAKEFAYLADNGDVYFHVERFDGYGKLAHQNLQQLQSGARIEVNEDKRSPLDFVLWKMAKPDEPSWPSPWGDGRPGWHIECSAMSTTMLGKTFDIHGGGIDLLFPHHQNEVAQSEASHDCRFVNLWMHNGHVQVEEEKMSKSLGNFFTIRDVVKQYNPEVIRYFMLASHYRSPINYSEANLNSAKQALERFYTALRDLPAAQDEVDTNEFEQRFYAAMDEDFNTPVALAVLFDIVREMNRLQDAGDLQQAARLGQLLKRLADSLGILFQQPAAFLQGEVADDTAEDIERLIADRNAARAAKDWAKADEIRDQLTAMGIALEDSGATSTWRKAD